MNKSYLENQFSHKTTLNIKNIFSQENEGVNVSINLTLVTIVLLGCGTLIFITKMILRQKEKMSQQKAVDNKKKVGKNVTIPPIKAKKVVEIIKKEPEEIVKKQEEKPIEKPVQVFIKAEEKRKEKILEERKKLLKEYKDRMVDLYGPYIPLETPLDHKNIQDPEYDEIEKYASCLYAARFLCYMMDEAYARFDKFVYPSEAKSVHEQIAGLWDNKEILDHSTSVSKEFYDSFYGIISINDQVAFARRYDVFKDFIEEFDKFNNNAKDYVGEVSSTGRYIVKNNQTQRFIKGDLSFLINAIQPQADEFINILNEKINKYLETK